MWFVFSVVLTGVNSSLSAAVYACLQVHSSSADCVRELFTPSKDLASLRVCNEKFFWF